jgi:glycosyltransferase involved in cell wall biosynthesis
MEALLKNEAKRMRLGANARLMFETRISLETLTKKMILLYQALGDQNRKRGMA